MQTSEPFQAKEGQASYGEVLQKVTTSLKGLLQSEGTLIQEEMRDSVQKAAKHATRGAVFGAVLAASIQPFLAFLVLGLGRILDGNYWLSSLIVAAVCAVIGGAFAMNAFKKLKNEALVFKRTRQTLGETAGVLSDKTKDVRENAAARMQKAKRKIKGRAA